MDTKEAGRRGGVAQVPSKGFGSLSKKAASENAKKAAAARWGKKASAKKKKAKK